MTDPKTAGRAPDVRELEPGTYYWCACGQSENQPYCDGSHRGTGFTPQAFTIDEARKAALCMCKRSSDAPFCDGSHKGLPS